MQVNKEIIERIKIVVRDIEINKDDIAMCHRYSNYEDIGFYQTLRSDLNTELLELCKELLSEVKDENK